MIESMVSLKNHNNPGCVSSLAASWTDSCTVLSFSLENKGKFRHCKVKTVDMYSFDSVKKKRNKSFEKEKGIFCTVWS